MSEHEGPRRPAAAPAWRPEDEGLRSDGWPETGPLVDQFGRQVRKLRVSLTDRCNFRCVYCMPEDAEFLPASELLTFAEIERVVRVCARLGVERVRLTGGEPLLRPGAAELVARLKAVPGLRSVSLTTNGFYLAEHAEALAAAGLDGVNVSLDTLDRDRFRQLARRDFLDRVLQGIAAAVAAGLRPVKVNCVVLRGVNEGSVEDLLAWARDLDWAVTVRFIEFMPLDGESRWEWDLVYTAKEILERARALGEVEALPWDGTDPARRYRFADGGEFGVIASVSRPFCAGCDRIRLTAEGKVRNCLFALVEHDLRPVLRGGGSDADLERELRRAVWQKWAGHRILRPGFVKPERAMYRIGG